MREVFSGDLIQFGVEVMENNRRGEKSELRLMFDEYRNISGFFLEVCRPVHGDWGESYPVRFLKT